MSAKTTSIVNHQVLEDIHYLRFPASIPDRDVPELSRLMSEWTHLEAHMHVLDFASTQALTPALIQAVKAFHGQLTALGVRMVSMNMSDAVFQQVQSAGAEGAFNRVKNVADLQIKKRRPPLSEIKRMMFRSLAHGALGAVTVALNSTASCDENALLKPLDAPLDRFDLMTSMEIDNDFLKGEVRLLAAWGVLEELCRTMHGPSANMSERLAESLALELLNMIYGHAKSSLNNEEAFELPVCIPKLTRKSEFPGVLRPPPSQPSVLPVITSFGPFYIELYVTGGGVGVSN